MRILLNFLTCEGPITVEVSKALWAISPDVAVISRRRSRRAEIPTAGEEPQTGTEVRDGASDGRIELAGVVRTMSF